MKDNLRSGGGEPGEAKAPRRKITITFLVLGQTLVVFPGRPLHHRQLGGHLKVEAHCLRLGRLAPSATRPLSGE